MGVSGMGGGRLQRGCRMKGTLLLRLFMLMMMLWRVGGMPGTVVDAADDDEMGGPVDGERGGYGHQRLTLKEERGKFEGARMIG
jgi:hypothetical protein